jgi:murein DD-endopeptidase MepM/ murein hydrolase activator NlpD
MKALPRKPLRLAAVLLLIFALPAVAVVAWAPQLLWTVWYWDEPAEYLVPVSGVPVSALRSTWGAPRSGGRKHRGTDIFAPKGTPVVSTTEGVVLRVGTNALGGNVVWVLGEGHSIYYYAHLADWAPGLRKGDHVRAGQLLGFVGNTGNAIHTPSHLHFAIHRFSLSGLFGTDPVPVLVGARSIKVAKPSA